MRHRRHLFVCVQRRAGGGKPACGDRGGTELLAAVERRVLPQVDARAGVTGTQCLGPCFDGPNAVIYPDVGWFCELGVADAEALAETVCGADVSPALEAKRHPWSRDDDGRFGDGDV